MDFTNLKWHRAGKISVLSGGTVVDGIDTNWLEADIKAGDMLITTDARPYEVASVNNSTQLTLTEAYKGDTVAGGDYAIILRVPAVMRAEIANRLVTVLGEWEKRDVSYSATLKLLTERLEKLTRQVEATGALAIPITIPITGWIKDTEDTTGYPFHVDIANDAIAEGMTPFLTVSLASMAEAQSAGLAPVAQTQDKSLRVFAVSVPKVGISATLTLFGAAVNSGGDNEDATDEEVWEAIEEVLNEP